MEGARGHWKPRFHDGVNYARDFAITLVPVPVHVPNPSPVPDPRPVPVPGLNSSVHFTGRVRPPGRDSR